MNTERLLTHEILMQDRARPLNEDAVTRLVESIRTIGLQTPLSVRWADVDGEQTPVLVAGAHRLEACKRLDIDIVDCVVFTDERSARMWEIAENLHRAELTPDERRQHIAEWMKLNDQRVLRDATPSGGAQPNDKAIRKAAKELGVSPATVSRAVAAESLPDEVKSSADEIGMSTAKRALLASAPSPAAQLAAIEREKQLTEAKKVNRVTDQLVVERRIHDVKEWLAARLDINELHELGEMLAGIADPISRALMREAA